MLKKHEDFYPNKKIRQSYFLNKNGLREGIYLSYSENGNKQLVSFFIDGRQQGVQKEYLYNGSLEEINNKKNFAYHGPFVWFKYIKILHI